MKSILSYILILFLFTSSVKAINTYELSTESSEEVELIEKITKSETFNILSKRVLLSLDKAKKSKSDRPTYSPQYFLRQKENKKLYILFDSFLI